MEGTIDSIHGIACPDEGSLPCYLYASDIDKWVAQ